MIRTLLVLAAVSLFFVHAQVFPIFAQSSVLRVYADERHNVHVVSSGKDTVIPAEEDQVGIDAIKVVDDK